MNSVMSLTAGQVLNGTWYTVGGCLYIMFGVSSVRSIGLILSHKDYSLAEKVRGVAGNALMALCCFIFVPLAVFHVAKILAPTLLILKTAHRIAGLTGLALGILGMGMLWVDNIFGRPMPSFISDCTHRMLQGHWISKGCLNSNLKCRIALTSFTNLIHRVTHGHWLSDRGR